MGVGPLVGIANEVVEIEYCWHALNQNRGETVGERHLLPGRHYLYRLNKFIVHMKQERGRSGVATTGCLAFYARVFGVRGGWRPIWVLQVIK